MLRIPASLLLIAWMLLAAPAWAVWERTGQTPSGAVYRFAVPEDWQAGDGLVIYQHDLSFERDLSPDLGPLLELQLAQGYAVAASGYSQAGWAVFASALDNRELVERFRTDVGVPGHILTYGASMGGYIALQLAEDSQIGVAGALAMCPAAAGSRTWDAALDLRVVYDAVCADVEGGDLPASHDVPWLLRPDDVTPAGLEKVVVSINRCIGVNVPDWMRSDEQRERLAMLKQLFDMESDDFLLLNLGYATLGLSDLFRASDKLGGLVALGNEHVDYGDEAINERVRRVRADPFAALDFRHRSSLAGAGTAKIVSLHTDANELVVPEHQQWLRDLVPAQRLTSVLVDESTPSQCGLEPAEMIAAWNGLRDWVETQVQPDAVELQARCLAEIDAGSASGNCRIDPALQPDSLDIAVRPRNDQAMPVDARISGHWYDASRSGEGWLIEVLDSRTAMIYGFTFPTSGEAGDQRWLLGTGVIDGNGVIIDEMYSMRGAGFGKPLASEDVAFVPWGSARVIFTACGQAQLRLKGTGAYGESERSLTQLMHVGDQDCAAQARVSNGRGALSGSWYDPAKPGQGLVIQARDDGFATLLFFGYGPDGEPIWLFGQGSIDAAGQLRLDGIIRPRGARYDAFDPQDIVRSSWGVLEMDFASCDEAVVRYASDEDGYGDGEIAVTRLTRPAGLGHCGLP